MNRLHWRLFAQRCVEARNIPAEPVVGRVFGDPREAPGDRGLSLVSYDGVILLGDAIDLGFPSRA
jgi:hypothetical protein